MSSGVAQSSASGAVMEPPVDPSVPPISPRTGRFWSNVQKPFKKSTSAKDQEVSLHPPPPGRDARKSPPPAPSSLANSGTRSAPLSPLRKHSAPVMDFRESGVYMGEVKHDPVLDKIRAQKRQNEADANHDSNANPRVLQDSESEPTVMSTSARGDGSSETEPKFYLATDTYSNEIDELAACVPGAASICAAAPTSPVKSLSMRLPPVRTVASATSILCSNAGRSANDELLSTVAEEEPPGSHHLGIEPLMRSKSSSCVRSGPKHDGVSCS